MPISFACPSCGAPYTVPDEVAGRSTKCRQCSAVMQIPAPAIEIVTEPLAPVSFAAPAEPETPENSGPMLRRLPLRFLIPAGVVAVLLFCLLPTYMLARWFFSGPVVGPADKYLPDKCVIIASVQVRQAFESPLWKQIQKDTPTFYTFKSDDDFVLKVDRLVFAISEERSDPLAIIFTSKPAQGSEFKKTLAHAPAFEEEKVGDITLYRYAGPRGGDKNQAYCIPERNVILDGHVEMIRAILKRNKKPELSAALRAALDEVDMSATLAVAASRPDFNQAPIKPPDQAAKIFDKVDRLGLQLQLGDDIQARATLRYPDAKTATEVSDIAKGFLIIGKNAPGLPDKLAELIGSVQLEPKGVDVLVTFKTKNDTIVKAIQQIMDLGARN
ncbi:MAG: hypothetical protein AB7K24_23840 [Gemmataceae bacterium]